MKRLGQPLLSKRETLMRELRFVEYQLRLKGGVALMRRREKLLRRLESL